MRNRIVTLGVVAVAMLLIPATSSALTVREHHAVQVILRAADKLPAPQGAVELRQEGARLLPLLRHRHTAVLWALVNDTRSPGSAAIHMAILLGSNSTTVVKRSRVHAASTCWGGGGYIYNTQAFGLIHVGRITITSNGWCGNGTSITWFGGFNDYANGGTWTAPGFCWYRFAFNSGSWLVFWSWVHGGIWATEGTGYKGACVPLSPSHAVTLREAANGYHDTGY